MLSIQTVSSCCQNIEKYFEYKIHFTLLLDSCTHAEIILFLNKASVLSRPSSKLVEAFCFYLCVLRHRRIATSSHCSGRDLADILIAQLKPVFLAGLRHTCLLLLLHMFSPVFCIVILSFCLLNPSTYKTYIYFVPLVNIANL